MKKLMILGASYSQVPLIRAAKKLGFYTIAASIPGDFPGFEEADEFCYADISKPEEVLEYARKLQIDGITTCCLDTGVPAIGYVCDKMGLKGPGYETACCSVNKWKMKKAFEKEAVSTARFRLVKNQEELERALEELSFPVIVKAVDLMGSRGIFRSNTKEEAIANYGKTMEATGKDYCLVEEFIEGTIFGTEAMIQDGELVFMLPNGIDAYQGFTPTPVGHYVPLENINQLSPQISKEVGKAVRALGIDNCPVNCDLILKDGKVYVIEITARAGATCLPELVSIYYGIHYYEIIAMLAMGLDVRALFIRASMIRPVPNLSKILISDKTGTVTRLVNENEPSQDIIDLSFNIREGDQVNKYNNGRDRIGQIIIKGDTLQACRERLEEVMSKIIIEVDNEYGR